MTNPNWTTCTLDGGVVYVHLPCRRIFIVPQDHDCRVAAPTTEGPRAEPTLGFDSLAQWSRRQSENTNPLAASRPGAPEGTTLAEVKVPGEGYFHRRGDEWWAGRAAHHNDHPDFCMKLRESRMLTRIAALTSEVAGWKADFKIMNDSRIKLLAEIAAEKRT